MAKGARYNYTGYGEAGYGANDSSIIIGSVNGVAGQVAAAAVVTVPVYAGEIAVEAPVPESSGAGSVTVPVYSGSIESLAPLPNLVEAEAETAAPIYTANVEISAPVGEVSLDGQVDVPIYTGEADVAGPVPGVEAAGVFTPPLYQGAISAQAAKGTVLSSAEVVRPHLRHALFSTTSAPGLKASIDSIAPLSNTTNVLEALRLVSPARPAERIAVS